MEIRIGVGRAVGRDEQVCTVEIRRVHGHELNLHRPLAQLGDRGSEGRRGGGARRKRLCTAARTAGMRRALRFFHVLLHGFFIVCRRFAFDKADRARRADRQAVSETVAVVVAQKLRLAVDHADRALVAGRCTQTAAVAFFSVDFNDLSYHAVFLHLSNVCFLLDFVNTAYYTLFRMSVATATKRKFFLR